MRRGFTLIELLVVMAIIATLLTIAVPRYFTHVERSREAVLRQDLLVMREAIDKFHGDTGRYPQTLQELVDKRYLRKLPPDPITERSDTWIVERPPGDDAAPGVYEVRSGAPGQGIDGSPYALW